LKAFQRLLEIVDRTIDLHQKSVEILSKIEQQISKETIELAKVVVILKKHQQRVSLGLKNFGSKVLTSFIELIFALILRGNYIYLQEN
jgi:hypothetical protein